MWTSDKLDSQLHWPIVDDDAELELCHAFLTLVRLKHEVVVNDHADRETWPDR
jgi:hypothetical protein